MTQRSYAWKILRGFWRTSSIDRKDKSESILKSNFKMLHKIIILILNNGVKWCVKVENERKILFVCQELLESLRKTELHLFRSKLMILLWCAWFECIHLHTRKITTIKTYFRKLHSVVASTSLSMTWWISPWLDNRSI